MLSDLDQQLARAVRSRLKLIEDFLRGLIADAQLILVDEGVVNAIDRVFAQLAVEHAALELIVGDPVAKAQGLEKILVDHVGAGGDDRIDHIVAQHVHEDFFQPGADERSGQAEDDAALAIAQHAVVNIRGAVQVARGEGHLLHRIDQRDDAAVLGDVEMLDRAVEEFLLARSSGLLRFHRLM
jgi:hypothetical protein